MDSYFLAHLIILSALILVSIFFSAVETSLLSFPRSMLDGKSQQPGLLGLAFKAWQEHPNRILTSILIGNNAVNIAATSLVAYSAVHLALVNNWSLPLTGTVASISVTIIIIVFAEALPKVAARSNSVLAATWLIVPIYFFDRLLSPFTWALVHMFGFFLSKVGHTNVSVVTEEDIKHMIEMGEESGTIQEEEKRMIHSVLKFTDTKANDVMVPRTEMFCVDINTDLDRLLDLVVKNGYSRMPVYKGNLDNIVGIINTRDLLSIWKNKELIVIQDLLRKPYFVPETMRVDRLLHEFQRGHIHMAIVVDEFGGTAGMVTMEDLVEEIVGEIRDEYDVDEEKAIAKQADGSWIIDAGTPLDEVNEALGVRLTPKEDVSTLGGYLMEKHGRFPKKGRVIEDKEAVFTVLEASEKKIHKVKAVKREVPLPDMEPEMAKPKTRKRKPKAPSSSLENADSPTPSEPAEKYETPESNQSKDPQP